MEFKHEIVTLLIENEVLVKKWQEFVGELKLKSAEIVQWEDGFNNRTMTPYELFNKILDAWKSARGKEGTLDILVSALNKIGTPFKYVVHNNFLRQLDLNFQLMQEKFITVNDYLGHGSFGVVFITNSTTAYRTAKKIMFLDSKAKLDNLKRMSDEYEIIKHKCHENVVKCLGFQEYSFGEGAIRLIFQINKATNNSVMNLPDEVLDMFDVLIGRLTRVHAIRTLCLEMELCGETLRKWLEAATTQKIIPNDQTRISITQDVISGLCFLHNNNILHRDLKPSNIYFSVPSTDNKYTFPIKIGDFGQAKEIEGEASCTLTVTGTRLYRAPEVEDQRYGKQADLFSLGLIIWEIFHPTLFKNVQRAFDSLRNGDQTIIEENSNVPNLKKLIVDLTQREKSKRIRKIDDVSLQVVSDLC